MYLILWLTHLRWKISWLYTWSCDWPIWDERYLDCISDRCKLWRSLWTTVFYSLLQVQLNIKVQSIFHLKKRFILKELEFDTKKKKLWKRANLQFSIYSRLLGLRLRTVQEHLQPPNIYEVVKVQSWNLLKWKLKTLYLIKEIKLRKLQSLWKNALVYFVERCRRAVSVYLMDPPCKEDIAWFITVSFKTLSRTKSQRRYQGGLWGLSPPLESGGFDFQGGFSPQQWLSPPPLLRSGQLAQPPPFPL